MATYPSAPPPDALRFLAEVPVFSGLDPRTLSEIAGQVEWRHIHGGSVLFRQGDEGDALYVVVSGRLRVLLERADRTGIRRALRDVSRGETVGEIALVTGEARTATVVALRDTELGRLSRAAFTRLLEHEPVTAMGLTRMLARWLASSNEQVLSTTRPVTIALVPLGSDAPLGAFAERVRGALATHGPTLHLNAEILDRMCGAGSSESAEGHPDYGRITAWLNDQEALYRFILYESDRQVTPWTVRCLSQADRVLRVAVAKSAPGMGPIPGERGSSGPVGNVIEQELVLLHEDQNPEGSEKWLRVAVFSIHHHMRLDSDRDFQRLARHLAGCAVALVLGGGGARGFAHIGVLRALEEAGIPIDRVGGASMGAVIAAQYAGGLRAKDMEEINRRGWIGFRPHRDFTLPLVSLMSGRRAGRMLKMMFGDQLIENLWLNYFCVSTNLSRAELMIHRHGPVRRWLRASISIPGTAPPLIDDTGDLLIDGGVLDNVPVAAMRDLGDSEIIAVDVSPDIDLVVKAGMKLAPSPWRMLTDRILRRKVAHDFPSLFQILYRTSLLSSIRTGKGGRGAVALYLEPPTSRFETFQMDSLDQIVEAGYRYAVEALAKADGNLGREGRETAGRPG
ncbi:MAG TPA: cyclic nucleotide-binding and patatin-like phospholipase domain-containing protein [Gemmatimonadales bacterium]|nr:cyclic nucleotide-binding and patatin-like phospholipase domain-containing protein [Gemmatimonadales bacterium]